MVTNWSHAGVGSVVQHMQTGRRRVSTVGKLRQGCVGPRFKNTQHRMGSISNKIRGSRGRIVSYLIATHAYADPILGVRVVGGTYTDRVVREGGRWVILRRTLAITSIAERPQPKGMHNLPARTSASPPKKFCRGRKALHGARELARLPQREYLYGEIG